jgi:hypothetical protein
MTLHNRKCDCCGRDVADGEGAAVDDAPDLYCIPCINRGAELAQRERDSGNWVWRGNERYKVMHERLNELERMAEV